MEKHYNLKHEVLIKTSTIDIKEEGKNYADGDHIKQNQRVVYAEYVFSQGESFVKAILHRDMIVDLYNQIIEIESKEYDGVYSQLPF